jgi:hypothetical protein
MADLNYRQNLNRPGYYSFTMPEGFETTMEIHLWGAGGGNSAFGLGAGGGYANSIVTIAPGDLVEIGVGAPGKNSVGQSPGQGGYSFLDLKYSGGDGGIARDEDNDTGPGAGGGAASAVVINSTPVCVAAGGGGGSGYGDDLRDGNPGTPGGLYYEQATEIYPVTLSYAWNSFMNNYAVWGGGQDYTSTINFPVTGTYTFNYAVDNYGQVFLDGSAIITLSGTVTSHFTSTTTYTATVSAGNHTVRVTGVNTGGPAGVAARIIKPDTTELWNTRALTFSNGLTNNTRGGTGGPGGSGGGGGGGGYFGGNGGIQGGDDRPAGQGGNGGQNFGNIIISGSGVRSGGVDTIYDPVGDTGFGTYPGYAVIILTRKFQAYSKSSGTWKEVNNAYVKQSGAWKSVNQIYIKNAGTWNPLLSTNNISFGDPTRPSGY